MKDASDEILHRIFAGSKIGFSREEQQFVPAFTLPADQSGDGPVDGLRKHGDLLAPIAAEAPNAQVATRFHLFSETRHMRTLAEHSWRSQSLLFGEHAPRSIILSIAALQRDPDSV